MKNTCHNIIIIIPSLDPSEKLITYIKELQAYEFAYIIVINDGSSSNYNFIFNEIATFQDCIVITHEKNRGKGAALKMGYAYIKDTSLHCTGVITVDSDGQHAIEDVCSVAHRLHTTSDSLIIGSRNFMQPAIPFKSRLGNYLSSGLFFCLYGKWIRDTQTGLRGFDISLLDQMIQIQGNRFEYEMQVIITCVIKQIPMIQTPIETIYNENNSSTHFNAFRDSIRVARVIFGNFIRFISSSCVSAIVDLGIAWYLLDFLRPYYINQNLLRIGIATCAARIISMLVNYCFNKKLVFQHKNKHANSFSRYLLLCLLIMTLSILFVYGINHIFGANEKTVKFIGDSLLFCISYQIQRNWVFNDKI